MSGKQLVESICLLLKRYHQLPYITLKKYSKYYLIPHRPSKLGPLNFQIARQQIREYSEKYNQYYQIQNIWERVSQKFQERISDFNRIKKTPQEKEFDAKMKEYLLKSQQYNFKYKEPLKLMAKNAYFIFRRHQYRRLKEQEDRNAKKESQSCEKIQKSNVEVEKQETSKKKGTKKNSLANIQKFKKMNLAEKWKKLTDEQRQIYIDMETKLKAQNQERIQQFIQNHEVPVKKRYSVIGRFTTRYASIHGLKLKDKKLYEIYHNLPQSERQVLKEQAKLMNQKSKQNYMNFLKKWNLSQEQLKKIIDICDKIKIERSKKRKATKKKNTEQKLKFQLEEEDSYDLEIQQQDEL